VYQKPLRIDDLAPDGVKIVVDWDAMVVGASIFIPCVNTVKAKKQFLDIAQRKNWNIEIRVRIENEMFGVRMWRTV
jgi:hypothetical protein|tara:strand:+ start:1335 stop:1562 length:228 start_codon:yes stop_codon:yes gene_type:complete